MSASSVCEIPNFNQLKDIRQTRPTADGLLMVTFRQQTTIELSVTRNSNGPDNIQEQVSRVFSESKFLSLDLSWCYVG